MLMDADIGRSFVGQNVRSRDLHDVGVVYINDAEGDDKACGICIVQGWFEVHQREWVSR